MRSSSKWSSPFWGGIFAVALSLPLPAQAQGADAGATDPAGSAEAAGSADPAAEPEQPAPPPGLKTLSPSQRLPENLQGWMRERQRRNPALVERRPVSETHPTLAPQLSDEDPAVAAVQRRLRSFSENGVTVLSNRRDAAGPVGPALTRVAAAAAVSRPAPAPAAAPAADPEVDASEDAAEVSVETRSLRAQASRHTAEETTPRWPAWLAVSAALGLFLVWLRKRRAVA